MKTTLIVLATIIALAAGQQVYPVAVFHGMGDACEFPGMKQFTEQIANGLKVYTKCIETGAFLESFQRNLIEQGEKGCKIINDDENFTGDISVIGLSMGGLVARSVVENCQLKNSGSVLRFVSIAGPHMGVATIPNCAKGILCLTINDFVRSMVYDSWVQHDIGISNMFNDNKDQEKYLNGNIYLPYLNNQKTVNQTYKSNFEKLEVLMLTMFEGDTVVNPKESEWFGFYDKHHKVIPAQQQEVWTSLGLNTLAENDVITQIGLPGNHLQFTESDVTKFFLPALAGLHVKSQNITEQSEGEFFDFKVPY